MDVGAMFDQNTYLAHAKNRLLRKVEEKYGKLPDLGKMEALLKEMMARYNHLKSLIKQPDFNQKIIEDREREVFGQVNTKSTSASIPDGLPFDLNKVGNALFGNKSKMFMGRADSINKKLNSSEQKLANEKKELADLENRIQSVRTKYDSAQQEIYKKVSMVRGKINSARDMHELSKVADENKINDAENTGMQKFLANVKTVGVGRNIINYSELTASNVALTGVNIEYNSDIYAAVAVGKIDYGFRDFFGRNTRSKGQQMAMVRFGAGDKEKKAVILSVFTGRKYSYGSFLTDSIRDYVNVLGYSLETILKRNEHTGLSFEIAKTTRPLSGSFKDNNELHSLVNFSDKSNLGISVKGQTVIHSSDTRISGFYRKTGENFQSFSLFTYNSDQTAWLVKVDQPLLKNKIGLVGMLRRNDFTNPFTEKTFKTSTIFKSIQATIRIPRYPIISVGYYPGSQLYIIDKERIQENAYYILNASVMYQFRAGRTNLISSLMYNKYSSKGTDSGFIAYRGINYMASQTVIFGKLQLQGMLMFTDQEQMKYSTLEMNGDFSLLRNFKIGAGLKYNQIRMGNDYWGGRGLISFEFKKLGSLQFQYDKSYLPTIYRSLFPVEMARVTWYKYF